MVNGEWSVVAPSLFRPIALSLHRSFAPSLFRPIAPSPHRQKTKYMNKNSIKVLVFTGLFLPLAFLAHAQRGFHNDKKLTLKLEQAIKGFRGEVGVYARNLKTGKEAAINADTVFPTASTIKVPIMVALFDRIDKGELSYHQPLLYRDSMAYGGSGIMQYFKDSTTVDLSVAASLMITRSDNTAALWCQSLAGGGIVINQWLAAHGFQKTRMNSRTPGRQKIWEIYGWGQTTPREMSELVTGIFKNKFLSAAACERMYRNMTNIYWDNNALSQIPPFVQTASKSGAVNDARSEVVLVNSPNPKGSYVFAIYTNHNEDQSWSSQNEADQLIRKISSLLWHYYNPHSQWQPPKGIEIFWGDE